MVARSTTSPPSDPSATTARSVGPRRTPRSTRWRSPSSVSPRRRRTPSRRRRSTSSTTRTPRCCGSSSRTAGRSARAV
ncbi:hypothetical protein N866_10195 [Actinotalea ferrariae CF5-4]|uniref:Uncharacterized protein n=1 Tax=Actinotalea ferrariae CF5-4 TaxID=948458 RepID=A0A021VVI2_9CELL|nr:hypothetical protein N866_10195 [Actinotalea ferrariae CF5-4]